MIDYETLPQTLKDFIFYLEVVAGKSKSTTYEYLLDLENFFRFMRFKKDKFPSQTKLHDIPINEINIDFVFDTAINNKQKGADMNSLRISSSIRAYRREHALNQTAFGELFGKGVFAQYLKQGNSFVPVYNQLLRSCGSGSCIRLRNDRG